MGSDEKGDEKPIHTVKLKDYWLCEHVVTQVVWAWVMRDTNRANPSNFKGENRPVERVS